MNSEILKAVEMVEKTINGFNRGYIKSGICATPLVTNALLLIEELKRLDEENIVLRNQNATH